MLIALKHIRNHHAKFQDIRQIAYYMLKKLYVKKISTFFNWTYGFLIKIIVAVFYNLSLTVSGITLPRSKSIRKFYNTYINKSKKVKCLK